MKGLILLTLQNHARWVARVHSFLRRWVPLPENCCNNSITESASYFERLDEFSLESKEGKAVRHFKRGPSLGQKRGLKKELEANPESRTLPEGIKIVETLLMGVSHYGVFCSEKPIKKGTRFGPFTGRNVQPKDIFALYDTAYTWEVSNKLKTMKWIWKF